MNLNPISSNLIVNLKFKFKHFVLSSSSLKSVWLGEWFFFSSFINIIFFFSYNNFFTFYFQHGWLLVKSQVWFWRKYFEFELNLNWFFLAKEKFLLKKTNWIIWVKLLRKNINQITKTLVQFFPIFRTIKFKESDEQWRYN